jgi:uncharacterized protein (DUF1684 family)
MTASESHTPTPYESEILAWRSRMDDSLRAENGWLTLVGLFFLQEGQNTVGSDPTCDIALPPGIVPDHLGVIEFHGGQASLRVTTDEPVLVDGIPEKAVALLGDWEEDGPSLVQVGALTFFVIRRGDDCAVRVRDRENPARQTFTGRRWYPIDPAHRLTAAFTPHPSPRTITAPNSLGSVVPMRNPGAVEFEWHGQRLRLEAFDAGENELWFVFKDATNGRTTYGAGRFLYAPLHADGTVTLDFNKAYSPPCAFTPYATCPLPPRENILAVEIEAGERS